MVLNKRWWSPHLRSKIYQIDLTEQRLQAMEMRKITTTITGVGNMSLEAVAVRSSLELRHGSYRALQTGTIYTPHR